jgi:hypothetical protein
LLQQKQKNGHHDNNHEPLIVAGKPMHQATPGVSSLCLAELEVNDVYVFPSGISGRRYMWRERRTQHSRCCPESSMPCPYTDGRMAAP